MAEVVTAEKWLVQTLKADGTLMGLVTNVYTYPIPPGTDRPYVLISEQASNDLMSLGVNRVWVNGLWVVRAVFDAAGWTGNLESAANRIDTVLHGKEGVVSGGNIWACYREQPFRLIENNGGQQIRHLGGLYRILVK